MKCNYRHIIILYWHHRGIGILYPENDDSYKTEETVLVILFACPFNLTTDMTLLNAYHEKKIYHCCDQGIVMQFVRCLSLFCHI